MATSPYAGFGAITHRNIMHPAEPASPARTLAD